MSLRPGPHRQAAGRRWAQQVTPNITPPSQLGCVLASFRDDPEAFCTQILRSCDARSALFDPGRIPYLHRKKGRAVDRSIYMVPPLSFPVHTLTPAPGRLP